jgi:hypothetical protein
MVCDESSFTSFWFRGNEGQVHPQVKYFSQIQLTPSPKSRGWGYLKLVSSLLHLMLFFFLKLAGMTCFVELPTTPWCLLLRWGGAGGWPLGSAGDTRVLLTEGGAGCGNGGPAEGGTSRGNGGQAE